METEPLPVSEPSGPPDDTSPVRPKVRSRSSVSTLSATLALALACLPFMGSRSTYEDAPWGDSRVPIDKGRRAEKSAITLGKAEAKRQRKAEKRKTLLKA